MTDLWIETKTHKYDVVLGLFLFSSQTHLNPTSSRSPNNSMIQIFTLAVANLMWSSCKSGCIRLSGHFYKRGRVKVLVVTFDLTSFTLKF